MDSVSELDAGLQRLGSGLIVRHAVATEAIPTPGEPNWASRPCMRPKTTSRTRANAMPPSNAPCSRRGRHFVRRKDHVIFEKSEIADRGRAPVQCLYSVQERMAAPPRRRRRLGPSVDLTPVAGSRLRRDARAFPHWPKPRLRSTNLAQLQIPTGASGGRQLFEDFKTRIDRYDGGARFPAVRGPSYLSVHLRFGTVSIRALSRYARSRHSCGAQ